MSDRLGKALVIVAFCSRGVFWGQTHYQIGRRSVGVWLSDAICSEPSGRVPGDGSTSAPAVRRNVVSKTLMTSPHAVLPRFTSHVTDKVT